VPCDDLSISDFAALVVALLDRLEIDNTPVVGHSMGGAIAQTLALDHASRVSSLVLSSTWAKSDPYFERAFAQRCEILKGLGKEAYARAQCLAILPPTFIAERPEEAAAFERGFLVGAAPDHIVLARIAALLAFDNTADLGRIACSTLVIYCRDDAVVPPHMSRDLAAGVPGASVIELSSGGHFAPLTVAEVYGDALQQFLTEQS
jgi:aminoacrylate hydrolase